MAIATRTRASSAFDNGEVVMSATEHFFGTSTMRDGRSSIRCLLGACKHNVRHRKPIGARSQLYDWQLFAESGRRDLNPRPPEPHDFAATSTEMH